MLLSLKAGFGYPPWIVDNILDVLVEGIFYRSEMIFFQIIGVLELTLSNLSTERCIPFRPETPQPPSRITSGYKRHTNLPGRIK